ncbi:DUF6292 family protein [Saccharothrix australiensis]|uniref:DUF6292 domain-containing protein n=1 Tax=Saccharothrix australiensis TaxID=2072 RepID=A0A495VJ61_9PSEU|nr:DUF6292 family protein [Saccharothrix australiensis]RKT49292.1 hypothetical protein C8E97_6788 [Saccharothrix australiensis]
MSDHTSLTHAGYVAAVVAALPVPIAYVSTRLVLPEQPRLAAVLLRSPAATPQDLTAVPQVWLCWTEVSGWSLGTDPDGRSGLERVRWAHLGVLPDPVEVGQWVDDQMSSRPAAGAYQRPYYRVVDDDAAFERSLATYAEHVERGA